MRIRHHILTLVALLCVMLGAMAPVSAKTVTDLYEGTVAVQDRSLAKWREAVPRALTQVLIKVTGNPNVATVGAVRNSLDDAGNMVQSYAYQATTDDSLALHVIFDRKTVNRVLRDSRQQLWRADRPITLLWVAWQAGENDRRIFGADDNNPLLAALQNAANTHAIPVMLPVNDLQDLNVVDASSVWQLAEAKLSEASKRYDANDYLAAKIINVGQQWQADCLYVGEGQSFRWRVAAATQQQLAAEIMDRLMSTMAGQYAVIEDVAMQENVSLRVVGVNGLHDYTRLVQYLRKMAPVSQVDIVTIDPHDVLLSVRVGGGEQALVRAIGHGRGHKLAPFQFASPQDEQQNTTLTYRYVS